jgi:tetratricopeptide (TPR) repeat protein
MKGRMLVVFFLLGGSVAAQIDANNVIPRVRVRLAFGSGDCAESAYVALIGRDGVAAEGNANDQCQVEFFNVPEGAYHLNVSARNFAKADSGRINMTSGGPTEFDIQVERPNELGRDYSVYGSAFVSASDLGVPSRARKEFDKASELVARQEFAQAIQRLNKAIAIYPTYPVAYNNLGVVYSRLGDSVREREALEKAVSLNDRFALAYVNLGRMDITSGDFPAAEIALDKAVTFDPRDPMTLILLSYTEFMNRRFDEAIATARKAHAAGKPHSFVHRVAARAFEQKRQGENAVAELESFLKEEPTGPLADAARQELEIVKVALPEAKPVINCTGHQRTGLLLP